MKKVKLAMNYSELDPSGLSVFGKHISTSMSGNAAFPSAAGILPLLDASVLALTTAIEAPKPDTAIITARVIDVQQKLTALKGIAEMYCNNSEEVALSSGFNLKVFVPRRPQLFSVKQGLISGTADLSCSVYKNAAYIWEIISDPINENTWSVYDTSVVANQQVTGLTPGNKYWFRIKTILSKSKLPYSDPYMIHVV